MTVFSASDNALVYLASESRTPLNRTLSPIRVDLAASVLPTASITLPYSTGSGQFVDFDYRCCYNSDGLEFVL